MHPKNIEAEKELGNHHVFKVCTGALYLRGYIRDDDSKSYWLKEHTVPWDRNSVTNRNIVRKYPQEDLGLVREL